MNGKSVLAAVLVACTAGACVVSLWNRDDAIWILALSSLSTLWYIFPPMAEKVMLGMVVGVVGAVLGVGLPGIGDALDAIGLLIGLVAMAIGIVLKAQKWVNFVVRVPLGAACYGLYCLLWSAARSLPAGDALAGTHHAGWFVIVTVLLAALAGVGFLLIVAGIYGLFDVSPAKAIIYTVGYPWYLILFLLTFLLPGGGDSLADTDY